MLASLTVILFYVFCALLKVVFLLIAIAYFTLAERKVMGSIHRRRGPNTEGFWGVLQPLFDGAKLILKELIVPTSANKRIFIFAPFIILVNSLSSWSLIPFNLYEPLVYVSLDYFITTFAADFSFLPEAPLKLVDVGQTECHYEFHLGAFSDLISSWYYYDGSSGFTYGILVLLTFSSLNVYSIIMAGWSSSSKYAFLGALRSASQMVSYEVVLSVVVLTAVAVGGTFDFSTMVWVQTQTVWFVFPLLPIFIIFLIAALAETNRAPFDLPEAEAELVAGYNVEYSAIVFALFFLAEYCNMLLMAVFCAIVFLGGWDISFCNPADTGPFLSSAMLTFKTMFFAVFFIVVRASFPRYRYDQLMDLGWKVLMPITTGFFLLQVSFLWTWDFLPLSHEGLPPLWYQSNTVAFNPLESAVNTFTSWDSAVLFFLASSIVFSAFLVPVLSHPVHSLLALICTLFQLGVVMISSSIQYFGFVFLLVYVGAISILFLFILMLFDLSVAFQHRYSLSTTKKTFSGIFLLGVIKIYFIFVDAVESFHHFCGDGAIPLLGRRILHSIYFEDNDSFQVSLELYKSYGLSYFFIVMLLLSAMLGSIIIAMYASSGTFRRYGFYNRLQVPLFTNLSNANFLAYSLSTFLSLDFTFKKVLLEVKSFSNPDDVLFNNLQRLNWYAWSIPSLSSDICVYPLYTSQCSTGFSLEQPTLNTLRTGLIKSDSKSCNVYLITAALCPAEDFSSFCNQTKVFMFSPVELVSLSPLYPVFTSFYLGALLTFLFFQLFSLVKGFNLVRLIESQWRGWIVIIRFYFFVSLLVFLFTSPLFESIGFHFTDEADKWVVYGQLFFVSVILPIRICLPFFDWYTEWLVETRLHISLFLGLILLPVSFNFWKIGKQVWEFEGGNLNNVLAKDSTWSLIIKLPSEKCKSVLELYIDNLEETPEIKRSLKEDLVFLIETFQGGGSGPAAMEEIRQKIATLKNVAPQSISIDEQSTWTKLWNSTYNAASYGLGWCQANPATALLGLGCILCVGYFIGPSLMSFSRQNPQTATELSKDVTSLKEISLIHNKAIGHLDGKVETQGIVLNNTAALGTKTAAKTDLLWRNGSAQFDMHKALARKVETQQRLLNNTAALGTETAAKTDVLAEEVISLLDIHVGIDNRLTTLNSVMMSKGTETAARVDILEGEVVSQKDLQLALNNKVETVGGVAEIADARSKAAMGMIQDVSADTREVMLAYAEKGDRHESLFKIVFKKLGIPLPE